MTLDERLRILQLFAGEGGAGGNAGGSGQSGDGAEGAASGDGTVVAAQKLRDMGVPEAKIARYAKAYGKRANMAPAQKEKQEPAEQAPQQAAAAETETAQQTEEAKSEQEPQMQKQYDWDEVMKDPEMNRRMQETVRASKRKAKEAEDALAALAPALKSQAQEYGLDPENFDYGELAKHMTGEYDRRALETGLPKDTIVKMERQQRIDAEQLDRNHIADLIAQGERMKDVFPGFDLRQEMDNPAFVNLVRRGVNVSVEDAYRLVHRREIEQAQALLVEKKATERVQATIRAGAARPDESGGTAQAPSVTAIDWRHATPEQLREQAKRIRMAAAQGRKLRPGE